MRQENEGCVQIMMFVGKEAEKIERLLDILEPYVHFNGTIYI